MQDCGVLSAVQVGVPRAEAGPKGGRRGPSRGVISSSSNDTVRPTRVMYPLRARVLVRAMRVASLLPRPEGRVGGRWKLEIVQYSSPL